MNNDFMINPKGFEESNKTIESRFPKVDKKRILPIVFTAIEIIAILVISGLATLVSFEFKLNEVDITVLILLIVLRLFLLFCSKDVSARTRIEQGQKDSEQIDLTNKLKAEGEGVNYDDFNKYLTQVENRRLKIEAYKSKFIPKINKHNVSLNNLNLTLKLLESDNALKNTKKINSYKKKIADKTAKIEHLERLISDEYIEKNFDILKIKFKELTASQFVEANVDSDVGRDIYSFDTEIENKKQILKGLPFCVVITLFISLIGLDKITYGTVNVLQLFLDIFCVAFYFSQGWFVVGKKTLSKQRQVIVNKIALLQRYKAYSKSNF